MRPNLRKEPIISKLKLYVLYIKWNKNIGILDYLMIYSIRYYGDRKITIINSGNFNLLAANFTKMKTIHSLTLLVVIFGCVACLERKTYLKCGEYLAVNEFLESTNGYYAVLQGDCNFVIYRSRHFVPRNALWSSNTVRTNCVNPILVNQNDGNVVIYNNGVANAANAIWNTATNSGTQCYRYVMQNDGNLVLYNSANRAVWNSGTSA